jgi:hypothetical protein
VERVIPGSLRAFARPLRRRPWVTVGLGVVAAAVLLLLWARTRPGYDPYGWLVWGYQTLHLNLDLGGAPSWKPLPYLFTVPYALAGRYALQLWMVTAVAVALAGPIFAGRIAYRLTDGQADASETLGPAARYGPLAAAVFAGAAVLGLQDYLHYVLSAQSDPMITTFCLAAIDSHLCGRYRLAFAFGLLGSLGRPEVWPFLLLYSLWAWFRVTSMRWILVGGLALLAFMWFGIPWITNGRPDVAAQLALRSPRELHQNKVSGTVGRFVDLQYAPVWLAAFVGVVLACVRRDRVVLALAAGAASWVAVEIAFALHGFPALPRYMFEAAAVVAVLGGVGIGRALIEVPQLSPRLPAWAGLPVAAVLVVSLAPGALARLHTERKDLRHERGRGNEIRLLQTTIGDLGGYDRISDCGEPVTIVEYASALAWLTRLDVGSVGYQPGKERRRGRPIVLLLPVPPGGWAVRSVHISRQLRAQCLGLHARYVLDKEHPAGVLIHG